MTRLCLVRHGQTDWNRERRIQGASDIPLNDTGRQQARETGQALARRHWDAIYSSPLSRAMETAAIVGAEACLADPQPVPALAERRYGDAEGLTGEQILARFPEGAVIPGQEERHAVVERALPALIDIARRSPDQDVIVVSHGGVIASLVRRLTDQALPAPGDVIPNGSMHEFVYRDGRLELDRFNLRPDDRDLFTAAVS